MNYYAARQRESDLRWDYSCARAGQVWPIGYCAGGPEAPYHDDGHETSEEAQACYRQFEMNTQLTLNGGRWQDAAFKCDAPGCDTLSQQYALLAGRCFTLCDEHRTRAVVQQIVGPLAGESASSY